MLFKSCLKLIKATNTKRVQYFLGVLIGDIKTLQTNIILVAEQI